MKLRGRTAVDESAPAAGYLPPAQPATAQIPYFEMLYAGGPPLQPSSTSRHPTPTDGKPGTTRRRRAGSPQAAPNGGAAVGDTTRERRHAAESLRGDKARNPRPAGAEGLTRGGPTVSRQAHNLEIAGSTPAPASTTDDFVQAPADGWLLTEQRCCEKCGRPRLLLARPGRLLLCSDCWRGCGSPFPVKPSTSAEVHAATVRIHQLMLERGGADAHRVHAGKA